MIAIRVVLVVSLLVAAVHADESHPEHNIRHGVHDKRYGGRGLHGDVHFTGFQGQPYTIPTESNSVYNLISMPSIYMNARITDMTTAQHCIAEASTTALPPRQERECLSYPGSYMTQIAVVSGDDMITIDATPRGEALIVKINGAIYEWSQLTIAVANATVELDTSRLVLTFTMKDIRITIHNIDRYLSVSVDILRSEWLSQGRREMIRRNMDSRYANNIAAASLPIIMHGLLGQSINYVIYPGGAVYQGDASEYMLKHLTSHQFRYSLYAPSADIAHVQYP